MVVCSLKFWWGTAHIGGRTPLIFEMLSAYISLLLLCNFSVVELKSFKLQKLSIVGK